MGIKQILGIALLVLTLAGLAFLYLHRNKRK